MSEVNYTLEEDRKWFNALPGKRASSAMILRSDDMVLMVKAIYKHRWTFPGGVVADGESPFETGIRETKEEAGVILNPEDVNFFAVSYVAPHYGFKDRMHFFFTTDAINQSVNLSLPPGEIESAKWVHIADITQYSEERPSYAKIQTMLETGETESYFEAF